MKPIFTFAFAVLIAASSAASAQEMKFNWMPGNFESVHLDPGYYHAGHVYRPGSNGGNMQVDIESEKPVTVSLVPESQWGAATRYPERLRDVNYLCRQEHVTKTTYRCNLPAEPHVLIVRDERANYDHVVLAGASATRTGDRAIDRAVIVGVGAILASSRKTESQNDLHIQYYRWLCVEHCDQPEFRWFQKAKEKYQLTPMIKVYGGIFPDHDGEQISVKIKSPVPMAVAVLPSAVANQLNLNPGYLQEAIAQSSCQQRAVQQLSWDCPLNLADGPLSVVVVPESTSNVPHKKAEIEVYETKCVEHCGVPLTEAKNGNQ